MTAERWTSAKGHLTVLHMPVETSFYSKLSFPPFFLEREENHDHNWRKHEEVVVSYYLSYYLDSIVSRFHPIPNTNMEMAAILPALTSLSFKDKSDEAYDREIRDFITYIKQFLINKNSSIISDGDRILDVS